MSVIGARALLVAVVGAVLGVVVTASAVAVLAGAVGDPSAAGGCVPGGGLSGLTAEQAANAATVVSTALGSSEGNMLAARIALMVAITESGLRDLGPGAGHLDSVGLFQQRESQGWGTAGEAMQPARATEMFVRRLLSVPAWSSSDPWAAAQQVQRSAFADGANYRRNWDGAGAVLADLTANGSAAGGCERDAAAPPADAGPPSDRAGDPSD